MSRYTITPQPFTLNAGDRVLTPDGLGTVAHTGVHGYHNHAYPRTYTQKEVFVHLDGHTYPVPRGEYEERQGIGDTYPLETLRLAPPTTPDAGALETFMSARHDPEYDRKQAAVAKKRITRPKKPTKLSDARRKKIEDEWATAVANVVNRQSKVQ